jgi:hypothetical protein
VPEILRYHGKVDWLLAGSEQEELIWSVDWNPLQEMSPGTKWLGDVVSKMIVQRTAVNQYGISAWFDGCQTLSHRILQPGKMAGKQLGGLHIM